MSTMQPDDDGARREEFGATECACRAPVLAGLAANAHVCPYTVCAGVRTDGWREGCLRAGHGHHNIRQGLGTASQTSVL